MNLKLIGSAACAAALTLTGAPLAQALAPAPRPPTPRPAAPNITHGPAAPGVCVLSVEGAVGNSTVGANVSTRLQQLASQAAAELTSLRTGIENDAKALDGQKATLDPTTFEQRQAQLQVRANDYQRKAQQRDQELQATEQKQLGRVQQELEPLIAQVYQQKGCSVLLNRQAVVLASPAMDITPQVIAALNAKLTQLTFDRERLDQPAPGAAPAGR